MESGDACLRKTSAGVDLNRNWAHAWRQVLSRLGDQKLMGTSYIHYSRWEVMMNSLCDTGHVESALYAAGGEEYGALKPFSINNRCVPRP